RGGPYLSAVMQLLGAGSWQNWKTTDDGWNVPGFVGSVRTANDVAGATASARANPRRTWMLGTEPHLTFSSPSAHSDFLHPPADAALALKAAAPTAVLVGPNTLKWDRVWTPQFVADYRSRYGALPLEIWGVHLYELDTHKIPMINASGDTADLLNTRAFLDANGLSALPIWITEWGLIWAYDGI